MAELEIDQSNLPRVQEGRLIHSHTDPTLAAIESSREKWFVVCAGEKLCVCVFSLYTCRLEIMGTY